MDILLKTIKHKTRTEAPGIYSHKLLNNIFMHPYTKIEVVMEVLKRSRGTASKYLAELEEIGVLKSVKLGRNKYYLNHELIKILGAD